MVSHFQAKLNVAFQLPQTSDSQTAVPGPAVTAAAAAGSLAEMQIPGPHSRPI